MRTSLLSLLCICPLVASASFNGLPFDCRMEVLETNDTCAVYCLWYPSPEPPSFPEATNVVAYYFKPKGLAPGKRMPAALCLHILGGGGDITKMICTYFASRGMPSLMPIMPMFLDRNPRGGRLAKLASPEGPRTLGEVFHACPLDIRRSLDVLASFPEVDPARINLIGTSLGGILATSAAPDPRIDKAVFMLAGGDLPAILSSKNHEVRPIADCIARATPKERKLIDAAFATTEPLNAVPALLPKAKAGRIRMINAAEDEIIPAANSRRLAEALGLREGKEWFILPAVGHYTAIVALPQLLEETAAFFGGDALLPVPPPKATTDTEVVKRVFTELNRLVSWNPAQGREMRVAVKLDVLHDGQSSYSGFGTLRRGPDGRFYFSTDNVGGFKGISSLRFGRDRALWIESQKGTAFEGKTATGADFEERLSPKFRMIHAAAILTTALVAQSGSLQALEKFVKLTLETAADGSRKVVISEKKFRAEVTLDPKRDTPTGVFWKKGTDEVRLVFTDWNTDAPYRPEDFTPGGAARRSVDGELLERTLSAVINFAIEKGGGL